jgi:hypothetical protein
MRSQCFEGGKTGSQIGIRTSKKNISRH